MNENFLSIVNNATEDKLETFMEKQHSTTNVAIDYEKVEFDTSWLQKVEDTIPYLDNLVRNPRRFIMQEEEIVPVEKARKITVETIKHLATHTNLIQDISEDGDITPSHLLNIHKEESFDIYENRFIYSLLVNLQMFIKQRQDLMTGSSSCKSFKKMEYSGETNIGAEKVKMSLNLETNSYEDLSKDKSSGFTVAQRLDKIYLIISDFMKSQFIKDLTAGQIVMVRSPITKTNAILKNTNLQKALELWEFIERYDVKSKEEKKDQRAFEDKGETKDNMDMSFFLNYIILNKAFDIEKEEQKKINKFYINKIVKDFVESNDDINEKEFIELLKNEFSVVRKERLIREQHYVKLFNDAIKTYYKDYFKFCSVFLPHKKKVKK